MYLANNLKEHNLLPDGFKNYVSMKLINETEPVKGYIALILEHEPNQEKAFNLYFEMLDKYLISLGYEPIPNWKDIKEDFYNELNLSN